MSFGAIDYLLSIKDSINFHPNLLEEQLFTQLRRLQQSRSSKDAKAVQPSVLSLVYKLDSLINQSNQLDSNEKAKAKIICRTLVQFCQHEASESPEVRAKFMAENVAHIMELEGKETNVILSAHNGHVAKALHFKEFGYYLRQKFQEQYYAVGFDFNRGSLQGFDFEGEQVRWKAYELKPAQKHSLGDVLLGCQKDLLFLDLRQAKNNRTLPKWFTKIQTCGDILGCYGQKGCNKRYWRINLAESYDAILFLKQTERAHRL
jgi:erythromycin esterase-like protein